MSVICHSGSLRPVVLLLVLCLGGAWAQSSGAREQEKTYPPYHGPKKTVAVLPFENKARGVPEYAQVGEGMTEMLITELMRTNHFNLVERDAISDVVAEQALGQTGLLREETTVKTGQMAGADYMIKGAVTEFHYEAGGECPPDNVLPALLSKLIYTHGGNSWYWAPDIPTANLMSSASIQTEWGDYPQGRLSGKSHSG